MDTPIDAVVQYVNVVPYGSALVADAAAGAGQITVADAEEFNEAGGILGITVNGAVVPVEYEAADHDTGVIHLTDPLPAAALTDEAVDVLSADGTPAVEWTAEVLLAAADEPVTVDIPATLVPYFLEGDTAEGAVVSLRRTGSGYEVASQPTQEAKFDGATVWNPYLARRMTGALVPHDTWFTPSAWAGEVSQGLTVTATDATVEYPGFYDIKMLPAFATDGGGRRYARILLNGAEIGVKGDPPDPDSSTYVMCFATPLLEVGDVIQWQVRQTSGAALFLSPGPGRCPVSMFRVSSS